MKILFVQESDWLKRNAHQQHHLAELMSLRGHQARVIDYEIMREIGGISRREVFRDVCKCHEGAKVTVIRPPIVKYPMLDYLSLLITHSGEIKRQVRKFKPDAIVGFGILNGYLAVKIAHRNGIPFIYYWIDVLHRLIPSAFLQPIGMMIERSILRQADVNLAINGQLRMRMLKMGALPKKTRVLRAGIDIAKFDPTKTDGSAVRRQYGFGNDDVVLFFMGWLYSFSGLAEVALALVESEHKNLKLLIVGDGNGYNRIDGIRRMYHLEKDIILTGRKSYDEIPSLISASDICLLPAYSTEKVMQDIVPIKMYEYMAMGKPVIATRLRGVMKEFGDGNGVLYVNKPEDVIRTARILVIGRKEKELGEKARKFAEKCSWDMVVDDFERIISDAIKERCGKVSSAV